MKTQSTVQDWRSIKLSDLEAAAKREQQEAKELQEWLRNHPNRADWDAAAENDD
jgi:hypothetical protein